ncbi:hypothetical protein [Levilactobacillus namurensis]|uniref:hypothetical protein n=2 Tax=Levilactobacillus namurensis TaxID=380393 RepID=UPI0026EEFA56|nr:hypothetical protein [Levilactobacillus namurensis]
MMQWKKLPRWMRDTVSVVGAMSILLIMYDWLLAKNVNWALVPLQIILALLAVGAWSYFSYRSQAKRKAADAKKKADAAARVQRRKQRAAEGAKQAAVTHERNANRNQQHQQRRQH